MEEQTTAAGRWEIVETTGESITYAYARHTCIEWTADAGLLAVDVYGCAREASCDWSAFTGTWKDAETLTQLPRNVIHQIRSEFLRPGLRSRLQADWQAHYYDVARTANPFAVSASKRPTPGSALYAWADAQGLI